MPKDPVEILMDSAIKALTFEGKPYHSQAQQAHELLEKRIRLNTAKRADQPEHLERTCRDIAEQLDRSHPISGATWMSWSAQVAQRQTGFVNRGHVLRRLADLRDTR